MAYTGSVDLISGIRPKNNGTFPLVDAKDVRINDSTRLDVALSDINTNAIRFDKVINGLCLTEGMTAKEYDVASHIETINVKWKSEFNSKLYKIVAALNTDQFTKSIIIINESGQRHTASYNASLDCNVASPTGGTIYIKFDWDTYSNNYNVAYDDSHLLLLSDGIYSEFTSDMNTISKSSDSLREQVIGLVLTDGATENEISVFRNFKYFIAKTGIDLTDFHINILTNTQSWPKYINITDGTAAYHGYFGDSDEISLLNGGIIIGYDWSNHTKDVNVVIGNSHIKVASTNLIQSVDNNSDTHTALKNIFSETLKSETDSKKISILNASFSYPGRYITENGTTGPWAAATLETYYVEAGKTYQLFGTYGTPNTNNTIAAFSTITSGDISVERIILMPKKTGRTEYHYNFTPEKNGYLYIVQNSTYDDNRISVALSVPVISLSDKSVTIPSLSDDIMASFEYAPYDLIDNTLEAGKYINTDLTIRDIANQIFNVTTYQVKKDDFVLIYGYSRLGSTYYPMVVYGETSTVGTQVLVSGETADVYNDYSVPFVVPKDGYIMIAGKDPFTRLYCYTIRLNYTIPANSRRQLKIQAFGDSITDNENNTWDGHTTWLNYIKKCFDEKWNLTIVNSAYGGATLSASNEYSVVNRVTNLLDETADVYTVWAGTNDYATSRQLGDLTSDTSTYIGALKAIIEYITTNTTKVLIIATPMQRWNSFDQSQYSKGDVDEDDNPTNGMYSLKELSEAAQKVCGQYGIPCIRMDKVAGFNKINISKFATDGLHPHINGSNERIATIFSDEIKRYFPIFSV